MENPPFREVRLPLVATATHQMTWRDGSGSATGDYPHVDFDLTERTKVCGVRVVCRVKNRENTSPYFQVQWRERDRAEFSKGRSYVHLVLPPGEVDQFHFYTDAWLDQIRVLPDIQRCELSLFEIVLLLPPEEENDSQGGSAPKGSVRQGNRENPTAAREGQLKR